MRVTMTKYWLKPVAFLMLAAMISAQVTLAGTATIVIVFGADCPSGSHQSKPSSTLHINENGDVTHVENTDCSGKRTTGLPSGLSRSVQWYNSFLNTDNVPSVSLSYSGGLNVTLETAAKIEVRDAYTGTLLATFPTSGNSEATNYSVPSSALSGYSGHLIVVDVIRTSDSSYRGTKSVVYNP